MSTTEIGPPLKLDSPLDCRVLLVEDDEICQDITLLMLRRLGYDAYLAIDGADAISALHSAPYHVVLMDVRMPRMNGVEATSLIRSTLDSANQPIIIAMTADTTPECREDCRRAGMDGYLGKPIRMGDLALALENQFGRDVVPPLDPDESSTTDIPQTVVYDREVLAALIDDLGGDEAMRADLIEACVLDTQDRLGAIQTASDAGDLEALAFQAHAIKSASAAVGLLALSETARALEAGARATPDDVDVGHQASLLATECDRAITAMRAALAGGQL